MGSDASRSGAYHDDGFQVVPPCCTLLHPMISPFISQSCIPSDVADTGQSTTEVVDGILMRHLKLHSFCHGVVPVFDCLEGCQLHGGE